MLRLLWFWKITWPTMRRWLMGKVKPRDIKISRNYAVGDRFWVSASVIVTLTRPFPKHFNNGGYTDKKLRSVRSAWCWIRVWEGDAPVPLYRSPKSFAHGLVNWIDSICWSGNKIHLSHRFSVANGNSTELHFLLVNILYFRCTKSVLSSMQARQRSRGLARGLSHCLCVCVCVYFWHLCSWLTDQFKGM